MTPEEPVTELRALVTGEMKNWRALQNRAQALLQRLDDAAADIESASRQIAALPDRNAKFADALLDEARGAFAAAVATMMDQNDWSAALTAIENARVKSEEEMNALGVAVTSAHSEAEGIRDNLSRLLGDDLTGELDDHCTTIDARLAELNEKLCEDLRDAVIAAYAQCLDAVEEASGDCIEDLNAATEQFVGAIGTQLEATYSTLASLGGDWRRYATDVSSSVENLARDLDRLRRDVESIQELVAHGMKGSGVGMHAAGGALNDLKAIFSEVS
jgi:chromosome segregation ATPase